MADKTKKEFPVEAIDTGAMDLDLIIGESWSELIDVYNDTLTSVTSQIGLVAELQSKIPDTTDEEILKAFKGLMESFKDLLKETFENSLTHATKTEVKKTDETTIEIPLELKAYTVETSEDGLDYINTASRYINIQDKLNYLLSTGWVDLFVKIKLDPAELEDRIATANKNLEETLKESLTEDTNNE